MKEKWVRINTIEGYENIKDCYWISNTDEDKIMNKNTGKQLKSRLDKDGYLMVNLMTTDNKVKTCRIHVIKAKTFIYGPNPLGATLVRHLNDCKTNNALINLAWGTFSDNMQDSMRNGRYNYETATKNITKYAAKNGAKTGAKKGRKSAKKTSKPVRCIETGIIYTSACDVERQVGIHNGSVNHCCHGRYKTAGGYHWEFVNKEVNKNDMECK